MKDRRPIFCLQWHITHACNLRCTHCYQEDYGALMPKEELFRTLDQFTALISGRDVRPQVNLTGGEPYLHPDFFPLAAEIRRRGYRLGILTNGTLLTDELAAKTAALHPVFVQISLDGTKEFHDSIRGAGQFDRALAGIDLLKAHGVKVLVSFTAQKANYQSFPALAEVCRAHRVDKLWWDRVVTDSPESTQALALTTEQFRDLTLTAQQLRRKYRTFGGKSFVSCSRALQAEKCRADNSYICSAGGNLIVILANGDVMPCRRLPFVIGSVREAPLSDILHGSIVMHALGLPRHPEGCMGCRRFSYCRGGSRCVTYAQTGNSGAKDVNCFYYP